MKRAYIFVVVLFVVAVALGASPMARQATAQDDKLVVYMQMGGTQGDGTTLARTNGASAAAEALGIELHEQYSSWDQQTMIDQFNEAHGGRAGWHRHHGTPRRRCVHAPGG